MSFREIMEEQKEEANKKAAVEQAERKRLAEEERQRLAKEAERERSAEEAEQLKEKKSLERYHVHIQQEVLSKKESYWEGLLFSYLLIELLIWAKIPKTWPQEAYRNHDKLGKINVYLPGMIGFLHPLIDKLKVFVSENIHKWERFKYLTQDQCSEYFEKSRSKCFFRTLSDSSISRNSVFNSSFFIFFLKKNKKEFESVKKSLKLIKRNLNTFRKPVVLALQNIRPVPIKNKSSTYDERVIYIFEKLGFEQPIQAYQEWAKDNPEFGLEISETIIRMKTHFEVVSTQTYIMFHFEGRHEKALLERRVSVYKHRLGHYIYVLKEEYLSSLLVRSFPKIISKFLEKNDISIENIERILNILHYIQ